MGRKTVLPNSTVSLGEGKGAWGFTPCDQLTGHPVHQTIVSVMGTGGPFLSGENKHKPLGGLASPSLGHSKQGAGTDWQLDWGSPRGPHVYLGRGGLSTWAW